MEDELPAPPPDYLAIIENSNSEVLCIHSIINGTLFVYATQPEKTDAVTRQRDYLDIMMDQYWFRDNITPEYSASIADAVTSASIYINSH
jgi:hypothetical protein